MHDCSYAAMRPPTNTQANIDLLQRLNATSQQVRCCVALGVSTLSSGIAASSNAREVASNITIASDNNDVWRRTSVHVLRAVVQYQR